MSLAIYFTKPGDTSIAGKNPAFIEALEYTASGMPAIRVANGPGTADIVLIDERYQYRTWRYGDELATNSFVRRHADRICVINHDDCARVFLPGLYVSLEKSRPPPLVHGLPVPYKTDLWQVPVPENFDFRPERLFGFRGTFHTHPIRKRLCRVLSQTGQGTCLELRKGFHSHDEDDQRRYIQEIRKACFSLCPRGLSPSSYRLYESMQLGRCPVVISDDWVRPAGPDWDKFTIFVRETEIRRLPEILLREAREAEGRGRLAYQAWQEFFSWPRRWTYFLHQVIRFHESNPHIYGFGELRDIWGGRAFRRRYGWTLSGRAKGLAIRKVRAFVDRAIPAQRA
jgi:hypothetical protein